jgi:hypothetical protein
VRGWRRADPERHAVSPGQRGSGRPSGGQQQAAERDQVRVHHPETHNHHPERAGFVLRADCDRK